jgi:DNA replication protein DnaC
MDNKIVPFRPARKRPAAGKWRPADSDDLPLETTNEPPRDLQVPEHVETQLTAYLGHRPTTADMEQIHTAFTHTIACPTCGDSGYVRRYSPGGKYGWGDAGRYDEVPCPCKDAERRRTAWQRAQKASHFADEMQSLTFAAFREVREPEAYGAARFFAAQPAGWLCFNGDPGTGKTHLLAAITMQLIEATPQRYPLYVNTPELLDFIRAGYDEHDVEHRFDAIRNADVLLLDDLGAERASDWSDERLYLIFNHRYNRRLPTVVATNIGLDQIEFRVASRLKDRALTRYVAMNSADYRETNARAKERNQYVQEQGA